jgi:hypothetical protein
MSAAAVLHYVMLKTINRTLGAHFSRRGALEEA